MITYLSIRSFGDWWDLLFLLSGTCENTTQDLKFSVFFLTTDEGLWPMKNISIKRIAQCLELISSIDIQVTGYQIDSRDIGVGDLFFALKGEKNDGHDFLKQVREKGAVGAVVSSQYRGPDYGLILLPVNDVADSLRFLAREFLLGAEVRIVGITGSVGKTTTKDFVASLLEGKYRVCKTLQSQNSKLTLPLTVLNRTGDEEVLVLEMGMSEPGDIRRLVEIAPPDIAVVTKVGYAHASFFPGGLPEIAKGKSEIFSHPKTRLAIMDHDFLSFSPEVFSDKWSFSVSNRDADYYLSSFENRVLVDEKGVRAYQFDIPFEQEHILHNFLAAVSVARAMNMNWNEIDLRIGFLSSPKMRFEQVEIDGVHFINDAYNANPESMRAALQGLPKPKDGAKRIAVLGSMKELGDLSNELHQEIGRFAQRLIDHLFVMGEEAIPLFDAFQDAKKPAEFFMDHQSLAIRLKEIMNVGDVVLVKGSRSMKMETIIDALNKSS